MISSVVLHPVFLCDSPLKHFSPDELCSRKTTRYWLKDPWLPLLLIGFLQLSGRSVVMRVAVSSENTLRCFTVNCSTGFKYFFLSFLLMKVRAGFYRLSSFIERKLSHSWWKVNNNACKDVCFGSLLSSRWPQSRGETGAGEHPPQEGGAAARHTSNESHKNTLSSRGHSSVIGFLLNSFSVHIPGMSMLFSPIYSNNTVLCCRFSFFKT